MGVTKEIITQGDGVTKPSVGQELTMHYTGTLLDGKEFDSSVRKNKPFQFRIGIGAVIQGNVHFYSFARPLTASITCG
jgi:FK506-binding protein 1